MIRCKYDVRDEHDTWVECGRLALEVTIKGPGGAYDYDVCPEHLETIASDREWWRALRELLIED